MLSPLLSNCYLYLFISSVLNSFAQKYSFFKSYIAQNVQQERPE